MRLHAASSAVAGPAQAQAAGPAGAPAMQFPRGLRSLGGRLAAASPVLGVRQCRLPLCGLPPRVPPHPRTLPLATSSRPPQALRLCLCRRSLTRPLPPLPLLPVHPMPCFLYTLCPASCTPYALLPVHPMPCFLYTLCPASCTPYALLPVHPMSCVYCLDAVMPGHLIECSQHPTSGKRGGSFLCSPAF